MCGDGASMLAQRLCEMITRAERGRGRKGTRPGRIQGGAIRREAVYNASTLPASSLPCFHTQGPGLFRLVQAQLYVAARAGHSATHCTAMNQVEPGASHPPTHLHSRAQGSTHLSWSSSWPQVLPCCTAPAGQSAVQHRTESQSEHQLAKAVTAARAPCPAAALATASRHPCQHTAATQHIMQYWWWGHDTC
jgi:hypothetical protein